MQTQKKIEYSEAGKIKIKEEINSLKGTEISELINKSKGWFFEKRQ